MCVCPPARPQVAALFQRHPSLFQHALERPDQLRRLFAWLRDDLGLDPRDLVRLVNRCPLVLQVGWGHGLLGRGKRDAERWEPS